jgi:hypothetical protein
MCSKESSKDGITDKSPLKWESARIESRNTAAQLPENFVCNAAARFSRAAFVNGVST